MFVEMRNLRLLLWSMVGAAVVVVATLLIGKLTMDKTRVLESPIVQQPLAGIGGAFSLVDHRGRRISDHDFIGRPLMVFFGFTHCPDICPTTLFETVELLNAAGDEAERIQVLFVSVDPQRDTRELLGPYVESFNARFIGATGTKAELDAMTAAFRASYKIVPGVGDDYSVDHTATVYLLDSQGRFTGTLDYHEERPSALSKLRRLARS